MKTVSTLAIAAILGAGSVIAVSIPTPVLAKDKKEEAPGRKLSPDVLKAAQTAQALIAAKDYAAAEPAVAQAEAAAKTDDDKYIAAALRYDMEQQRLAAAQAANPNAPVDETVLAKPLDALIANPTTPADTRGRLNYRRGALAYNGKQYASAIQYFQQAKQLGYSDDNIDLQIAQAKVATGDVQGGLAQLNSIIDAQVAAGKKPPEDYYKYGLGKAYAAKMPVQTFTWMQKYIAAYPTPKNWRAMIVIYGFQQDSLAKLDKDQQIDLFRLMRSTNALADQVDYEDYAQKLVDRGLPSEAKTVLQEGITTGKVPSSSANAKAILAAANKGIASEGSMSSLEKQAMASSTGKLADQTADAYLAQGNYAKAVELYRAALQKGGVNTDEVNTRLGISLAQSGDKAGATAAFAAVTTQPRKDIAALWTTHLQTSAS